MVHFVDVFRALMKRILQDKKIDYRLSPNLNTKITKEWDKKHKECSQKKSEFNALEQQAGQIMTKWAKNILNKNKAGHKKGDKKNKIQKKTKDQDMNAEKNLVLQENARIILNIIQEVKEDDDYNHNLKDQPKKDKLKYTWMGVGG